MPAYTSKEMSIMNAKAFIESLTHEDGRNTKSSNILYAVLGNQLPYATEPTAPTPIETDRNKQRELWKQAIGGKRITVGDVSHVIPRYDWTSGTVYSQYRDTDTNLYNRQFYVLNSENSVFKCLYNNRGAASTIEPKDFSTLPFTLSDGYTWKYMYTISLGDADKFLTGTHMPVKTLSSSDGTVEGTRQLAVQNASVNGSIDVIETVNLGSGYHQVSNGVVVSAGSLTIQISSAGDNPPSPRTDFYTGSSIYIYSGTGAGQIRRIVNYDGGTKTITANSAFSPIANTDSRVIISPTIVIRGDGQGALAYTEVNGSGQIANVSIINVGSGYSEAVAIITANSIHGSGATANVIISPVGGHGKDAVRELGGDKVLLNAKFKGSLGTSVTGAGFIPANTDFRSISILRNPILKVNSNNAHVAVEHIANTSNSPNTLRLTTRLNISYESLSGDTPVNEIVAGETLTTVLARDLAAYGDLEFVTQLNPTARENNAINEAIYAANGDVVFVKKAEDGGDDSFYNIYLNSVQSYSNRSAFTNDSKLLKRGEDVVGDSGIATVSSIKGPEANTFSGEFIYTENIQKVTRDVDQTEDIKIILDF